MFGKTIAWALLLFGLALASLDVVFGPWDHDGGLFLLHASYIAEGLRPYLDYSSIYPPLIEALTALPVATGMNRLALTIALPILWIVANTVASALLVFVVTRDRRAAVLAASLFPLFAILNGGNHLTLEHGVVLFSTLAFAIAMSRLTPARALLAGAFVSAAALSKQPGVIALLPLAAIALTHRQELSRRHAAAFATGLALPLLATLAWLGFRLSAIYRNIVHDLLAYAHATPVRDEGWKYEFHRSPDMVCLFAIAIVFALALIARAPHFRLLAASALIGGIIEFLPRLVRNYPHYNLNIWPFLILILALALGRWPKATATTLLLFLPLSYAFAFLNAQVESSPLLQSFSPAASLVQSVTPKNAPVRQYGTEPIIEFLASRHQEQIDWGARAFGSWKGTEIYGTPLKRGTTIVVVDHGEPWVAGVKEHIRSQGFQLAGKAGDAPHVYVYTSGAR